MARVGSQRHGGGELLNESCTICECQFAYSWLVLSFLRNVAFLLIQERQSFTLLTSEVANWIVLWENCIAYCSLVCQRTSAVTPPTSMQL